MENLALNKRKVDFSNVCYLGLRHTQNELRSWEALSSPPSFLNEDNPLSNAIAQQLALLQGCEAGLFAASTLHLFWDLFDAMSSSDEIAIYYDDEVYPIARWGIERAVAKGVPSYSFSQGSHEGFASLLSENARHKKRPIVVLDGVSSVTRIPMPLPYYLQAIEPYGGIVVVDDTQAIGLLGHSSNLCFPFGLRGGGSIRWHGFDPSNIVLVSSLAKGFGVPIAMLSGSARMINWFRMNSLTLEHCSSPCFPLLHAVENALDINESKGDELRTNLIANIRKFQTILHRAGFLEMAPLFPVQSIVPPNVSDPEFFVNELQNRGVGVLFQHSGKVFRIILSITAAHSAEQIDFAAHVLVETLKKSIKLNH